jgi:hypothetical protein
MNSQKRFQSRGRGATPQSTYTAAVATLPCQTQESMQYRQHQRATQSLDNRRIEMRSAAALVLVAALQALPAYACSYLAGWRPPSPQSAFETAQVVVHARVVSQTGGNGKTLHIETDSLEWCQAIADQAMTASAASGKANNLSLECQAR